MPLDLEQLTTGQKELGKFVLATLAFWGAVLLLVAPFERAISVDGTPGRVFVEFLAGHFPILFTAYCLGALGASTAMQIDGGWVDDAKEDDADTQSNTSMFGRLAVGAVAGFLSYLALSSGLLSVFVQPPSGTETETQPSPFAIMLFASLFGFYAPRVFENAAKIFNKTK